MGEISERPLASEDNEQAAVELFPLTLSPEEYAARKGIGWMCFSFDDYRFRDARLDVWIQRLGEILRSPDLFHKNREQYLTAEEIAEQDKWSEEDL